MLIASGYSAEVNIELCAGCGTCQEFCQFSAIKLQDEIAVVDLEACFGCGVCVDKCDNNAVLLKEDPSKGIPLEIHKLMEEAQLVS